MKTTELERLVYKVVGDATGFANTMLKEVPKIARQAIQRVNGMFSRLMLTPTLAKQFAQNLALGFSRGMMGNTGPLKTFAAQAGRYVGAAVRSGITGVSIAKQVGQNLALGVKRGFSGSGAPLRSMAGQVGRFIGMGARELTSAGGLKRSAYNFGLGFQRAFLGITSRMGQYPRSAFGMMGHAVGTGGMMARQGLSDAVMGTKRAAQNFVLGLSRGLSGSATPLRTFAGNIGRMVGTGTIAAIGAARRGVTNFAFGAQRGFTTGTPTRMRTGMGQLGEVLGRGTRMTGVGLGLGVMGGIGAIRGAGSLAMGGLGVAGRAGGALAGAGAGIAASMGKAFQSIRAQGGSVFDFLSYRVRRLGYDMQSIGRQMLFYLTLPIAGIGTAAIKAFASFDDAMTTSEALMGGVSKRMRREMEETALSISGKSRTGPTDIALGYYHLASAGYKAADAVRHLGIVEQFAVAGAFDLNESGHAAGGSLYAMGKASDYLVDIQAALGKRVENNIENMKNMTHIGDVLTQANIIANATVKDFADALTGKGAAAIRLMNKDLEEGVAVLAAYAAQGVKGAGAGEKLYIITRDLQKAVLTHSAEWKRLNISVYDSTGNMLQISKIIQNLEKVLGPMSDETKRAALMTLGFQDRSLAATIQLLGMGKAIEGYEEQLRNAGGTMQKVSDIRMSSFTSQMMKMRNQVTGVAIGIGKLLVPYFMRLNAIIEHSIDQWNSLSEPARRLIVITTGVVASIGPLLLTMGILIVAFEATASATRVFGSMFWAMLKPVRVAVNLVVIFTRALFEMTAAVVLAAVKIGADLAMSFSRLLIGGITAATTAVFNLIGAMVSLISVAGPIGALGVALGAMVGFAGVALTAVSGLAAAASMLGTALSGVLTWVIGLGTQLFASGRAALEFAGNLIGKAGIADAFKVAMSSGTEFIAFMRTLWKDVYESFVGFMENFETNMGILFNWLRDNWAQIGSELGRVGKQMAENMAFNFTVVGVLIRDVFSITTNWLSQRFQNIWIDFLNFAKLALGKALLTVVDWGYKTAEIMAGALAPGGMARAMIGMDKFWEEVFKEGNHVAEDKIGDMLGAAFKHNKAKFKGMTAGVGGVNLPAMPKFIFDIMKPAEEAEEAVEGVGKAIEKVRDEEEGNPITVGFQVQGLDALRAGTAAAMSELMNARRMAAGGISVGGKRVSPVGVGGMPGMRGPDVAAGAPVGTAAASRKSRLSVSERKSVAAAKFASRKKVPKFIGDYFTRIAARDAELLSGTPSTPESRADMEAVSAATAGAPPGPGGGGSINDALAEAINNLSEGVLREIATNTEPLKDGEMVELDPADISGGG